MEEVRGVGYLLKRNWSTVAIYETEFISLLLQGKSVTAIYACCQFRDVREQITLL
jgi:hypothetical protein